MQQQSLRRSLYFTAANATEIAARQHGHDEQSRSGVVNRALSALWTIYAAGRATVRARFSNEELLAITNALRGTATTPNNIGAETYNWLCANAGEDSEPTPFNIQAKLDMLSFAEKMALIDAIERWDGQDINHLLK